MNWTFNDNFHRNIIFCNIPLSGYYRFKSVFQIRKGESNWPNLNHGFISTEPIVFEYNSKFYRHFNYLNQDSSNQKAKEFEEPFRHFDFKKELFALLTLSGNANFFEDKKYTLNNKELGEDYFIGDFIDSDLGQAISIDNKNFIEKYNHSNQQVSFPTNIDLFFSNYFELEKNYLHRFRMSLMLYYNSIDIRTYSPSMSFVALISVIENLVDFEGEITKFKIDKCTSCGQDKFKVSRRFKDFMIKYCENDSTEFKRYLGKVYSLRSDIAHSGELLYNDYANTEYDFNGENKVNTLKLFVRIALFKWIIKISDGENK